MSYLWPSEQEVVDTSDAVYERRHRKYETFEKRQRLREKETLQYEHFKLRERMEELKVMDAHAFERVEGMDGIPAEDRKRLILKEAEDLDRRYVALLGEKKGMGILAGVDKKRGELERAGSDMSVSDISAGVSRIRLRIKRGKVAYGPEPDGQPGDGEAVPPAVSDDEREAEDAFEVERTIGVDGQPPKTDDEGEEELEADDDEQPVVSQSLGPRKRRRRLPRPSPSISPPRHPRSAHSSGTHGRQDHMPKLIQAALKSKEVAQPTAKRRQAHRGTIAFGVNMPASFDNEIDYELPRWIIRDVEILRGVYEEEDEASDEEVEG